MLTYDFHDMKNETLTAYLYRKIREDILEGRLKSREKMPSKRTFSRNMGVSTVTVENVYAQLVAEGYLDAKPRSGYYVAEIGESLLVPGRKEAGRAQQDAAVEGRRTDQPDASAESRPGDQPGAAADVRLAEPAERGKQEAFRGIDLADAKADPDTFPFGTWAKIIRQVLQTKRQELLTKAPGSGVLELREEIARYLLQYQNLAVSPEQIIIGAGTEYLYSLLIRLLGSSKVYAVETPGYPKTARIYETNRVKVRFIPMDSHGISMQDLEKSGADVVHISPSHQFPTGVTMPVGRRAELLCWAKEGQTAKDEAEPAGRYIIEDDYDSEFRLAGRPIPPLMSIDRDGKVICLNTFTKSLASTIRISYMVLPLPLLEVYREKLGFYSCTVSNFEQYTLAEFIRQGYFEKHINRMRTFYRRKQDLVLKAVQQSGLADRTRIIGEDAGLHFLMEVRTDRSEQELSELAGEAGVRIFGMEHYRGGTDQEDHVFGRSRERAGRRPCMVVNYSGLADEQIERFPELLTDAWGLQA